MKLGLSQSLRTELGLRLSPQILQRIEVLQLPALDLVALVEQELQENEALEVEHDAEAEAPDEPDDDYDTLLDDDADDWRPPKEGAVSAGEVLAATAAASISLTEHLSRQLDEADLAPRDQAMAQAIVEALNSRGWLELPLRELSLELSPPPDDAEREHALRIVQRLDPAGVGCRDLEECLLLQLDPAREDYPLLATLVLDHLDDIARNRVPRIVRETGRAIEEVLAGIDAISHLDPVPGRSFGGDEVPVLRPDVVVLRAGEDYEIALENDWLPRLTVSRACVTAARDRGTDPALRKHMRGKIEAARSLIDAVAQRKHTLFRVANEIVQRQPEFLESGRSKLRPMRMADVAEALGVHVSTVSRAIAGKSMQTPRGIVPLKQLFTGEVPARVSADGTPMGSAAGAPSRGGESRAAVQELVRAIIAAEDTSRPLSDEAIVGLVAERHGLKIARRTVTKYRKALGLGSSRARRTWQP
ncbi:MAG: RNA polymerase sigma-54 factor [Planctomycetota bacterium]|nr:MAG: RNA polymerase sigma-54 factor [Planctomycetota bacterium]